MRQRLLPYLLLALLLSVSLGILWPSPNIAHKNARRRACASNLSQVVLALQYYSQDNNNFLPPRGWGKPLLPSAKTEAIFQCPETSFGAGTSDYFFNARLSGASLGKISSPVTLVLMGDGQDNAPFGALLFRLPSEWAKDERSPAPRHLGFANYLFADGHVKWFKPQAIDRNFRVVKP